MIVTQASERRHDALVTLGGQPQGSFMTFVRLRYDEATFERDALDGGVQSVAPVLGGHAPSERGEPFGEVTELRLGEKFLDELTQTPCESRCFAVRSERCENGSGARDRDVRIASGLRLIDGAEEDAALLRCASHFPGELGVAIGEHGEQHSVECSGENGGAASVTFAPGASSAEARARASSPVPTTRHARPSSLTATGNAGVTMA